MIEIKIVSTRCNTKPAHIVWGLVGKMNEVPLNYKTVERKKFLEGAKVEVTVTKYERNMYAREACIKYHDHDHNCQVCKMNFKDT